jgi:hypothetical protein
MYVAVNYPWQWQLSEKRGVRLAKQVSDHFLNATALFTIRNNLFPEYDKDPAKLKPAVI